MAVLFEPGLIPAFDSNGRVISGAQLHFYHSGSSVRVPVYTAPDETMTHENPVEANSAGRFPPIYLRESIEHRVRLTDAHGALIPLCEIDPLNAYNPPVPSVRYYRFGGFAIQTPLSREVLVEHIVTDAFTLPADLGGSAFDVGVAPTKPFAFTVTRNGVSVATMTMNPDRSSTATTLNRKPVPIGLGDVIAFVAPLLVDPTVARLRWTLKGTL